MTRRGLIFTRVQCVPCHPEVDKKEDDDPTDKKAKNKETKV